MIDLDDLTELQDSTVFQLEMLPTRSYEKDTFTQLDITIERNLNQRVIARNGYTVLDFLSDVGGMESMLYTGSAFLLTMWNYNHLDNFLVLKLYRTSNSQGNHGRSKLDSDPRDPKNKDEVESVEE